MELEETIANECIRQWGVKAQLGIAIEECSELITQLIKLGREVNGSTIDSICDEIADVEIMMFQLRVIFEKDELIDSIKEKKLKRLKERLNIR